MERRALIALALSFLVFVAFIYLGTLIEFDETERIFNEPVNKETREYVSGKMG